MKKIIFALVIVSLLASPVALFAQSSGSGGNTTLPGSGGAGGNNQQPGTGTGTGQQSSNPNSTGSNPTVIDLPNPLACTADGMSDAQCLIMKIFSALWIIASLLTTLMILVGAFQLMTSGGNPEKVTKARNTIMYAIIGFTIVILSWSVTAILKSLFDSATQ